VDAAPPASPDGQVESAGAAPAVEPPDGDGPTATATATATAAVGDDATPQSDAPPRSPCDAPIPPPPYLRYLLARADDSAQVEHVRSAARIVRAQARVDELVAGAPTLLQMASAAQVHFDGLPKEPVAPELDRRRYAEDLRQRPPTVSHARRRSDHTQAIATAGQSAHAAEERYRACLEEIARIKAHIAAEQRVCDARIQRVREHMLRRTASYWRHLVRHHPHGPQLSGCLDPAGPDLPAWRPAGQPPRPDAPETGEASDILGDTAGTGRSE